MANIVQSTKPRLRMGKDEDGTPFYYDTTTRNVSFLQCASDLKKLGIKNNAFFLKLYDRSLVGVDPFSSSLTAEQINRINVECTLNPYYFIRECARIPSQGGATGPGSGDMFTLHRGNLAAVFCFFNCIDFYLVIPRQCFKTGSVLSLFLWAFLFGTANSLFNFSNKTQTDADDNLDKLKKQKEVLPIFMQQRFKFVEDTFKPGEWKMEKGLDNVRRITNPQNKNTINSKPSARTLQAADTIGRGNSAPLQYYDEVEFTDYIGTILKASGPAYLRAANNSKKNGAIYGRVLSSTPGNLDSQPVEDMNEWRENMAVFSEQLYDKNESEVAEYIQKNARNGFVYIEFNYKQIGMDETWYKAICETLNWDKIKIKREVLLQRIRGNSKSPFDPEDVEEINSYRTHPIEEYIVHNDFLLRVYKPIDKTVPYIIGVDCATGTNNDATVATFVDPYTLYPVAIIKSPLIDEPDAAEILIELLMRFAPKGVLAIERNNIGSSIINLIRRTKYVTRLYNDPTKMDNTPDDKLDRNGQLKRNAENSKHWGVYTDGKSRERMMQILLLRVRENKDAFICNEIIDDINNLIQKSSGRIEAESGKHDDCIMSYLIAMYTYMNGYKLSRYGIIKGIKREVAEEIQNKEPSYEDLYKALPEEWRAVMPKPGGSVIATDISADIGLPQNMFEDVGTKKDEALYNQIMSVQQRRRMHKLSVDPDNADIDNEYIEEMVKQAQNKERGGFTHAQFDIAKILSR